MAAGIAPLRTTGGKSPPIERHPCYSTVRHTQNALLKRVNRAFLRYCQAETYKNFAPCRERTERKSQTLWCRNRNQLLFVLVDCIRGHSETSSAHRRVRVACG